MKEKHIVPNLAGPPGPTTIMALDWEPQPAPWRILGSANSPYSIKVRAYCRYKAIPHRWIPKRMNCAESDQIAGRARLAIVPTVASPEDDAVLQDSTPILEHLEATHPEPSIHPKGAPMRFVSCLLEVAKRSPEGGAL